MRKSYRKRVLSRTLGLLGRRAGDSDAGSGLDGAPEGRVADAGFGRKGNDLVGCYSERLRESGQRFSQLIVGDPVSLGRDDEIGAIMVVQPVVKLKIRLLWRNRYVDQRQAECQRRTRC